MTIELVRPKDLSAASSVNTDAAIPVDNGAAVENATPKQVVDAGRPIASEAQAIAGIDNTTSMTPLTTRQAIDADTSGSIAKARAWAESTGAPGDPGTKSSKTWAEEAAASAAATEAIAAQFDLDDQFTGDGTTTPRELGFTPNADTRLVVFIDGLAQPTTAFSYVGTTLVPSEAWPIGLPIRIMGRVGFAVDPQPASTVSYGGDTVQTKLDDLDKGAAPDRATAVSRISGGWVPTNGMLYLFGAEIYQGFTGATAIADMPGLIPVNPTPEHHGCAGDWDSATQIGTDDQTRFVEFLAYLGSSRVPGRLPARKNYRLTAPIVIDQFDIDLQGAGGYSSIITLDHTSKIGFQNRRSGSTFANLKFEASDVRRAGAGKTSIAFLLSDTAGGSSGAFAKVHHVNASGHPGHGIVNGAAAADISQCIAWDNGGHGIAHDASGVYSGIVTAGFSGWSNYELCRAYNCGGHGIYFDRGEKSGRTNLVVSLIGGLTNITGCRFSVDGHTICIGSPNGTYTGSDYSTPGLRVIVENCEGSGGEDAAIRYVNSGMFIRGANHSLRNNGFNHPNAAMFLAGRNIRVENHRSLGDANHIAIIGSYDELSTQGIIIDGVNAISPDDALNPAVIATLPSGEAIEPQDIFLNNILPSNVTSVAGTDATMGSGGALRVPGIRINGQTPVAVKSADQTINNTITQVNDADLRIWLKANETIYFDVVLAVDGDATADFRADVAIPVGGTVTYSSPSSIKLSDSITAIGQGALTTGDVIFGASPGTIYTHKLEGYAVNGSTAGWMIVRWAQGTATVADTTLKAGLSRMIVRRV